MGVRPCFGVASLLLASHGLAFDSARLRIGVELTHASEPECSVILVDNWRNLQMKPCTSCNGLCDWYVCVAALCHRGRYTYRSPAHREIFTTKKSATALVVHRAHDGNVWQYACFFALSELFSIGVPCVCYNLKTIHLKCSLRSVSHGLEAPNVGCLKYHGMGHYQGMFSIDGSLDDGCLLLCVCLLDAVKITL
jgi:hypothetical protein